MAICLEIRLTLDSGKTFLSISYYELVDFFELIVANLGNTIFFQCTG
jgi:hypothetical protein